MCLFSTISTPPAAHVLPEKHLLQTVVLDNSQASTPTTVHRSPAIQALTLHVG